MFLQHPNFSIHFLKICGLVLSSLWRYTDQFCCQQGGALILLVHYGIDKTNGDLPYFNSRFKPAYIKNQPLLLSYSVIKEGQALQIAPSTVVLK